MRKRSHSGWQSRHRCCGPNLIHNAASTTWHISIEMPIKVSLPSAGDYPQFPLLGDIHWKKQWSHMRSQSDDGMTVGVLSALGISPSVFSHRQASSQCLWRKMHYVAVTFGTVPEGCRHGFDWQTSFRNLCCPIIHQMLHVLCGLVDFPSSFTEPSAPLLQVPYSRRSNWTGNLTSLWKSSYVL